MEVKRKSWLAAAVVLLAVLLLVIKLAADRYEPSLSLHEAALAGNARDVRAHLRRSVDVNMRDSEGGAPIHYAAAQGHREIVKALLDAGADVNIRDQNTAEVFMPLAGDRPLGELRSSDTVRVDLVTVQSRYTPLHLAVENDHTDTVGLLLSMGADPNLGDCMRRTPLHRALWHENLGIAKLLLEHGAKADIEDLMGTTPLDMAEEREGLRSIVDMLRQQDADQGDGRPLAAR